MAPPFGLIALVASMSSDAGALAVCSLVAGLASGDDGWVVLVVGAAAALRLVVSSVLCVPTVGAVWCSHGALEGWIGMHEGVTWLGAAWEVVRAMEGGNVGALAWCLWCGANCRLLRGAVDYVRAGAAPELEVYISSSPADGDAWSQHLRTGCFGRAEWRGSSSEATTLLSPRRAALARFAARSASIREFWRRRLLLEVKRARRLARHLEHRVGDYRRKRVRLAALDEVFGLVLRLFAHEDVLEELVDCSRRERSALVFHSLQLCAFALFGAYPDVDRLRGTLLRLCEADVVLGHRVRWYLEAFAAAKETRLTRDAARAVEILLDDVRRACPEEDAPEFFRALTKISAELRGINKPLRDEALRIRLARLDENLPRTAYVPFLDRGTDQIVRRLHVAESRVFSTKERCPFLACLEVDGREYAQTRPLQDDLDNRREEDEPLGRWRSYASGGSMSREVPSDPSLDEIDLSSEAAKPEIVFREPWMAKEARILGAESPRRLVPVIVKAFDDLRQEQLAAQLVAQAAAILEAANVGAWLRPYDVLATGPDAGLIEAIPDTVSLDALRRHDADYRGLLDFFHKFFGPYDLARARAAFVDSLAPACILSYLLQLKDRHNANILLDSRGHITHIDFGYILESSPGGNFGFEAAPFKLTNEFLDVIGPDLKRFKDLCLRTFLALRKQRHRLILLLEMTVHGCEHLPCFAGRPRETIQALQYVPAAPPLPSISLSRRKLKDVPPSQVPLPARPPRPPVSRLRQLPHRPIH